MNLIIAFVLKYWLTILIIGIIFLVVIIGYYADTNGLIRKKENHFSNDNVDSVIPDSMVKGKKENMSINSVKTDKESRMVDQTSEVLGSTDIHSIKDELQKKVNNQDETEEVKEQNFEQFETEFEQIIPEKPIISDELKRYMEEFQIKPVSLPTKKISDLSDIELPNIEKDESDDDIWG